MHVLFFYLACGGEKSFQYNAKCREANKPV